MGSDQKVVVIADPGIRRTRPPETAVLAYRAVVAWGVRGVLRPISASGSLIHTRLERGRVCAPGQRLITTHKYLSRIRKCGPAPYPALTQIDVMGKAVAVGWLSWLVRVHSIAIIMYDI